MRGIVSFHPVDLRFFDELIGPLTAGEKVNPEAFLETAVRSRESEWFVKKYKVALERLLTLLEPPPPPEDGSLWDRIRTRLESIDYKPDPVAKSLEGKVDSELHLHGRPFLIFEASTDRVSNIVDEYLQADSASSREALVLEQLMRVDRGLGSNLEPATLSEVPSAMSYRNDLLGTLKSVFDLAKATRSGGRWGPMGGTQVAAAEALPRELPWNAVYLHSRAIPFWAARDVDGLETVCHSAGVEPPSFLAPAWRLFPQAVDEFPQLRECLTTELRQERDVGAFVAPDDIGELLAFLNAHGTRIIHAASRHGVGATCATLLRKIRECAHHAQRHGFGYLEACGIRSPAFDPEDFEDDL